MQILPLIPSLPDYRFSTVLNTTPYIIDVYWNARDGAWYMDLRTEDETLIRAGMKLVLGTFPGARSAHPFFRHGSFVVIDTSGEDRDATFDDMGTRVLVYYMTRAELIA